MTWKTVQTKKQLGRIHLSKVVFLTFIKNVKGIQSRIATIDSHSELYLITFKTGVALSLGPQGRRCVKMKGASLVQLSYHSSML